MKDSIIINGTKERAFNCLKRSVIEDIKNAGIDICDKDLGKGYRYSKKSLSKDNKTYTFHVTISEFDGPNIYESTIRQGNIKYVTRYEFKEKNDSVEVTYTERIFNDKGKEAKTLFNWILFFFKRKQLKALLMQFKDAVEKGDGNEAY